MDSEYSDALADSADLKRKHAKENPGDPARGITVLEEADIAVDSDRQAIYGSPREDFERTAAVLSALGFRRITSAEAFRAEVEVHRHIRAEDIPHMMCAVKLSRLTKSPKHRDSIVDLAGYARTMEKLGGV